MVKKAEQEVIYESDVDDDYCPSEHDAEPQDVVELESEHEPVRRKHKRTSVKHAKPKPAIMKRAAKPVPTRIDESTGEIRKKPDIAALMATRCSNSVNSRLLLEKKRAETVTSASKKSWAEFKKSEGKDEELEGALEGGYLQEQAFLQKADHAEWRAEVALKEKGERARARSQLAAQVPR